MPLFPSSTLGTFSTLTCKIYPFHSVTDTAIMEPMPKRSSKPRDLNKLAASIVGEATSEESPPDPDEGKDPHAVALGRKGGRKGGKARAEKLTAEQRSAIARRAARARWDQEQAGNN